MSNPEHGFVPALRFSVLTPLYDFVVRLTTRERHFRSSLLDAAPINDDDEVLDVGCGTGTLLREISRRAPSARLTGLDADPVILRIAREKFDQTKASVELIQGNATDMPFPGKRFEHVVSSLFFHHLLADDKQATLEEIVRVLRPGGFLHVADWGRPAGRIQRFAFYLVQLLDGFETTREHTSDRLPERMADAGLAEVTEIAEVRTMLGTLRLFRARKNSADRAGA